MGRAFRSHELLENSLIQGIVEPLDLRATESLELGKSDPTVLLPPAGRDPEDQGAAADRLLGVRVIHDLNVGGAVRLGTPEVVPHGGHRPAPPDDGGRLWPPGWTDAREILRAEPLEITLGGRAHQERPDMRAEDAACTLGTS